MGVARITHKYIADNTVIGYCIELSSADEANKYGRFYNIHTDENRVYVSYNNTDILRDLGVLSSTNNDSIKITDVYAEAKLNIKRGHTSKTLKSNHEMAKAYEAKAKLLNIPYRLKYKLLPNDNVRLVKIESERGIQEVIIPPFITSYTEVDDLETFESSSPFELTEISSIIIQNKPGVPLSLGGVFSYMSSKELKIRLAHPECVYNMENAFESSDMLIQVDLRGFTGENLVAMNDAFHFCSNLRTILLNDFKPQRLIEADRLFARCYNLTNLVAPNFKIQDVLFKDSIFYKAGKYE